MLFPIIRFQQPHWYRSSPPLWIPTNEISIALKQVSSDRRCLASILKHSAPPAPAPPPVAAVTLNATARWPIDPRFPYTASWFCWYSPIFLELSSPSLTEKLRKPETFPRSSQGLQICWQAGGIELASPSHPPQFFLLGTSHTPYIHILRSSRTLYETETPSHLPDLLFFCVKEINVLD